MCHVILPIPILRHVSIHRIHDNIPSHHHPDSTLFIQETTEYVMNKLPKSYNTIANDLQVTLTN
ncbi:hypothetical protein YC2023_036324 [Brassica napus]